MGINLSTVRKEAFRLRGGIWTALFLLILLWARPAPSRIFFGLALVVAGQLLRFWAVGCITLYRGEQVKAARLTTWGPYAAVRNPLYVGNGLIGLGWAWMSGPGTALFFLGAFALLYGYLIVPHEEAFLEGQFGQDYRDYKARVGAFFPKSTAFLKGLKGPYDRSVLLRSEVHSLWITVAGTVLILSRLWW